MPELFPVQIADFTAWGMSIPEKLNFGGAQRLGVHQLPNGIRIIDSMGPDDDDITWSGQLITRNPGDPDPVTVARYLDNLRKTGAPVPLSWEAFTYLVVIEHFKCSFEYVTVLPFSMVCKVVSDLSAPSGAGANPDVDDLVNGDWSNSLWVMPGMGMAVPTGLPGPFSNTIGAVTPASTNISFVGQGYGQTFASQSDLTLPTYSMTQPDGQPVPLFNSATEAQQFQSSAPPGYASDYIAPSEPTDVNPDGSEVQLFATEDQATAYLSDQEPGFSAQFYGGT